MRAFYAQLSGLAGLAAFLNRLWSYAPLERSILVGMATGIGIYVLLLLGDVAVNRILMNAPSPVAEKTGGAGAAESSEDANEREQPKARAA
jgi:hypothetical protein